MRSLREWIHRLWSTLPRGGRPDSDLEEELRLHEQLAVEDARRRGLDPREAVRSARIGGGPTAQAMDAMREQRGLPWLDESMRDLRHGIRILRRSPSFTAVAMLTLALGIGANTAIYQLLDAIRIRTLAVKDPEQLAIVGLADATRWSGRRSTGYPSFTNPLWEQFRDHQDVFSGVLAWSNATFRLDRSAGPRIARGLMVSGDFFNVLGVEAHQGRLLTRADDRPGCGLPGAIVSYGFWQRYFGGDTAAIGRTLSLDGQPAEVIGVTPPGFSGAEVGRAFDVAVPICSQASMGSEPGWLKSGTMWWLVVMGRLAPGQSLEAANRQLDAGSARFFEASLPSDYPRDLVEDYLSFRLRAAPGATGVSALRGLYADPLVILQLTTAIVLFIACTNLANLVLARASAREREFAVRLAMGGSWRRLVRQLMVENALLALGGGIAGLGCAAVISRLLVGQLGPQRSLDLPLDLRLIGFTLATVFLTSLAFGLIPAWRASRVAAADAMKSGTRGNSSHADGSALRRVLVVAQVACSLFLLFGGLLFATTLRNLLAVDPGFDPGQVAVARLDFSSMTAPGSARTSLMRELLDRIRQAPGVTSAAEVRHVPMGGSGSSIEVTPVGGDSTVKVAARLNAMSPGYLRTMGIALIAGRDFDSRDTSTAPRVAIINHTFAGRIGLAGNPLGQRFRSQTSPTTSDVFEIVGLVPDSKYFTLREDPLPIALVPMAQIVDPRPVADVMIRSAIPPGALPSAVERIVSEVNPLIAVEVRALESNIRDGVLRERLMAGLSGALGLLAALIAAIGVYGVMSYLVLRRTGEFGVRLALGAQRRDVRRCVLREAAVLVAIGVAIGSAAAFTAADSVDSLVYGLPARDGWTLALASLLLGATAMAAAWLPARRAAALPPITALREA